MLPITHKALGTWSGTLRLHALDSASTEAEISLSVSGVREEVKETRTRSYVESDNEG